MKPGYPLLTLAILFFILPLASRSELPVFTGKLKNLAIEGNAVKVQTDNAQVMITAYSPTIIRVRYDKKSLSGDFSYAVIRQAEGKFRGPERFADSTVVSTDSLKLVLYHSPFRVAVRNLKNEIINEDYFSLPVSWQGTEVTCYKKLFSDERFLGLGEKTGNLNKRGGSYQNWNSDVPAYATNHDPLYQSIPFYIGVHDKVVYGIFLDNSFRTSFNFGASTDEGFSSFSADDGEMNYYIFGASSIKGILSDYTWLTGRMPLPPYWSLGYQQCRWSYFPESQVMSIAQSFRDKKIPCDVIYLDIDYMDKYKIFTWNSEHFPQPWQMINNLNSMGFHVVTIVDPGIKIDKDYFAYNEGVANHYFATYPDGSNYTGSVWPGRCHFPDFTNDNVRKWWGKSFSNLTNKGVEGFWNDMNEPSAWGQSIPGIVMFDFEGRKGTLKEAHNIYGLKMSQATYEGTKALLNGKRSFALTRAGFAGIQRYSAVWTGDNAATDDHMLLSARMVTGMGLSGISFTGPDVGGFMGNPDENLFTRWMSLGVYTPFFRSHSAWDTKAKEPWAFGLNVERMVREMIGQRYRLLPYIYSAFYESSVNGMPVARALPIDFTFDEKVYWYVYQNQYLFGRNIMVAPVSSTQTSAKIYLPEGEWYRLSDNRHYEGNQEVLVDAPLNDLPVFARGSGIIPMQSLIQNTGEKPSGVLEIHVYQGKEPNSFTYYEDDGKTYQYETEWYYRRDIKYEPSSKLLTFSAAEGKADSRYTSIKLVLHGFGDIMIAAVNGIPQQLKLKSAHERTVEIPLKREAFEISF